MTTARDLDSKGRSPLGALGRILRAHYRLVVCGAVGATIGLGLPASIERPAAYFAWLPYELSMVTRGLLGWNVAVFLYLIAAALLIARSTHESIRRRAMLSDEGRTAVLFLTAAATCVAFQPATASSATTIPRSIPRDMAPLVAIELATADDPTLTPTSSVPSAVATVRPSAIATGSYSLTADLARDQSTVPSWSTLAS